MRRVGTLLAVRAASRFMLTDLEPVVELEGLEDCELYKDVLETMPGSTIQPVHPAMVMSFDDAATHMGRDLGQGTGNRKPDVYVGNAAHQKSSKHSSYHTDEKTSSFTPGIKLEGAHATNATGQMASICQKVVLPAAAMDKPIEVLELQYLRTNEGAPPGHIVFVREDQDKSYRNKVRATEWIMEHCVVPFINKLRTDVFGWEQGDPINLEYTAVLQLDGCNEQIELMQSSWFKELCRTYCITIEKSNASATAYEAAADVMQGHKERNRLINVVHPKTRWAQMALAEFDALVAKHPTLKNMPPAALAAMRRVVPYLSRVYRLAYTEEFVIDGHRLVGNIGEGGSWWPSKQAILDTRRKLYTPLELAQLEAEKHDTFPAAYATGEVDESIHAKHQLAEDTDPAGKVKPRYNDRGLRSSRGLIVTHPGQDEKKNRARRKVETERQRVWKAERDDIAGFMVQSRRVEEEAALMLGRRLPGTQKGKDRLMKQLTYELIDRGVKKTKETEGVKKWSKDLLLAYAAVRRLMTPTAVDTAFRTTIRSSDDQDKQTLVRMVLADAGEPVVMVLRPQPMPPAAVPAQAPAPTHVLRANPPAVTEQQHEKASVRLADPEWQANVKATFKGGAGHRSAPAGGAGGQAAKLARAQAARFRAHKMRNPFLRKKSDSYCLGWFGGEIPTMSALVSWAGHSVKNPAAVKAEDPLAVKVGESQFLSISEHGGNLDGCYGWFDENGYLRRSGKAQAGMSAGLPVSGGIGARDKKHVENAGKVGKSVSKAYEIFPGKVSGRQGEAYFEDLDRVILLGYDSSDPEVVKRLTTDGDIFNWPADVVSRVSKVNFGGTNTTQQKQLHFVAYALELFYELMIGSDRDVSESSGFETPLGVHITEKKKKTGGGAGGGAAE